MFFDGCLVQDCFRHLGDEFCLVNFVEHEVGKKSVRRWTERQAKNASQTRERPLPIDRHTCWKSCEWSQPITTLLTKPQANQCQAYKATNQSQSGFHITVQSQSDFHDIDPPITTPLVPIQPQSSLQINKRLDERLSYGTKQSHFSFKFLMSFHPVSCWLEVTIPVLKY